MGYNSAYVKDFRDIFAPINGFSGMGHRMLPIAFFPDRPPLPWQQVWDKMGFNSACVRYFREIFAPIGGFWGWAVECCQWHFSPTDLRCHGNEIWAKTGINSPCVKDFCEIFAPMGGFSRMSHRMLPIAFFTDGPPLPWQRNL